MLFWGAFRRCSLAMQNSNQKSPVRLVNRQGLVPKTSLWISSPYRRHAAFRTINGGICCGLTALVLCFTQLLLLGYHFIWYSLTFHWCSCFFRLFSQPNIFTSHTCAQNQSESSSGYYLIDPFSRPLNQPHPATFCFLDFYLPFFPLLLYNTKIR
jgi:hypothetical protein